MIEYNWCNMGSFDEYLKPTDLCDFDKDPEIKAIAYRLTQYIQDKRESLNRIYQFVRELPYVLENWDVKASDTLRKGRGMCSGKSNLLVAMCRALMIPSRYQIFKIEAERTLWKRITQQNSKLATEMGEPLSEHDHVIVEVYLDKWEAYDPSRDSAFEEGLKRLGITLERKPVIVSSDSPSVIVLASIDEWAANRQEARRFRRSRELIFSGVNEQFDQIRFLARG
jgi:transglutaminase-like putative cysteine protease